jgi:ubiquinone/menaquinone biosynthesis C-methylase UbiE
MAGDNKSFWDGKHQSGIADHLAVGEPTEFAVEVQSFLPEHSKILELGCGQGQDAVYFAKQGHEVAATDFSDIVIEKNKQRHQIPGLTFGQLDISRPMPFANETFDVVYSSLSLHYFTDGVTKNIFKELARILKTNGQLSFVVKSIKDFYYDKGTEIEKDMYDFNGDAKHFFSEAYVKECLSGDYEIVKLESGEKQFFTYPAAYIKTIARKTGNNS